MSAKKISEQAKAEKSKNISAAEKPESPIQEAIILSTIQAIKAVELEDEVKDDPIQQRLLQEFRDNGLLVMRRVLEGIQIYVDSIYGLERVQYHSRFRGSAVEDMGKIRDADRRRQAAHNDLMLAIKNCYRYLNRKLNRISEEELDELEAKESAEDEERARLMKRKPVAKLKRANLLGNGITPAAVNLDEREEITEWAMVVYKHLKKLKEELD